MHHRICRSLLIGIMLIIPARLYAISPGQELQQRRSNIEFLIPDECTESTVGATNLPGKVYMVGDSLSVGLKTAGIEKAFEDKGWGSTDPSSGQLNFVNAAEGRALKGTSDGLSAISQDSDHITAARAVVIELGTNIGDNVDFAGQVSSIITAIRAKNSSARIYWVNIGATTNATVYAARNKVLVEKSASTDANSFSIIDWFKLAHPTNDPLAFTDGLASSLLEPDYIHPTAEGYTSMRDLIVNQVTNSSAASAQSLASTSGNCCTEAVATPAGDSLPASVPEPYKGIFEKAGAKHNVAPALVAGIFFAGEHGSSWPNPPPPYGTGGQWASSSKAAQGPFQFLTATWNAYGDDGNGDGKKDIQDLTDGAFGAAHYLGANGGTKGSQDGKPEEIGTKFPPSIRNAIWHYNHADWYVERVFNSYTEFLKGGVQTAGASTPTPGGGCATTSFSTEGYTFPVSTTQKAIRENKPQYWCPDSEKACHHDYAAADIASATGTPVVAARGGTVTQLKQNAGKYGATLRIKGDDGRWYYYAHMGKNSIDSRISKNGQVQAGQVLGSVGTSEDAEGTSPHLHFDVSPEDNSFSRPSPKATATLMNPQPLLRPTFKLLREQ